MALLDPADLTFNGEEARSMSDAVIETIFENPAVTDLMTVYDNIITTKQIPFLGQLSKITKADAGCGLGQTAKNIPMSEKFWEPAAVKIWLTMCGSEVEGSFWVFVQNTGVDRDNVTGTDIARFVVDRMSSAAQEDLLRIIWFNDTAAANVSGSGTIKNGVSLADYNIIDGLWKQIFAIVATTAARKTAIAKNAQSAYATQLALGASDAIDTFRAMIAAADSRLNGAPNKFFIATRTLVENYATYLESQGNSSSFERIENGYVMLRYRGIPVYGFDFWDRTIQADIQNGTKYDLPHRAILTVKENLAVGYDASNAVADFRVWYSEDTELNNFKGKYRVDAKVLQDYMIQVAY